VNARIAAVQVLAMICVASGSLAIVAAGRNRSVTRRASLRSRLLIAARRGSGQMRTLAPGVLEFASRRGGERLIARAGLAGVIGARDLAAVRVLAVLVAALMVPRLVAALPPRMLILAVPLWLTTAAELPLWWLRRRAALRMRALLAALPDSLDLLCAALAAGLPLRRALGLAGDHSAEPVAGEFAAVAAESALGVPQSEALEGLLRRNPLPEMRALVSAVQQAERHGSPLAPVVAAQARETRLALNRAVIEHSARAAPKIQLIVSMTIVPGAMLAMAAAVIAAIARGDIKFL
jgi:tight adherence protein C